MKFPTRLALAALTLGLAACDPPASSDPMARQRMQCADAARDPAERAASCDALIQAADLEDADRAAAFAFRGQARSALGEPTAALADFNAALALNADDVNAKLGRAGVLLASGQLDAAAPLIENVIAAADPPALAHYLRGDLFARSGNRSGAITEFDAAIASDPHMAGAFAQRGLAKQADLNYADARRDFDAAIRIDRENAPALAGRCWNEIYQEGALAPARSDAENAVAAQSNSMDARLCLGLVLLREENWGDARAAYDAALAIEPASAAALFGRGVAKRELGDRSEGAVDIRRAYEFNSNIDEEFERLGVDF